MNFSNYIKKYESELTNSIIPFWEKNCIDKEYGGFFHFLDRDGSVFDDTIKYMWMNWRIVYMFSELYMTKYKQNNWLDIAKSGYDFLTKHGKDENGQYYFALTKTGLPAISSYDNYSNCFAAMGSASLYKATGEKKYEIEAKNSFKNFIDRIENPKGKWEKKLPNHQKYLSLGFYMMTANIGYEFNKCFNTDEYNFYIKNALDLVLNSFWSNKYQVIFENILIDKTIDLNSTLGRQINPGHGLEAMWFFLQYGESINDKNLIQKIGKIIISLLDFGWDKKYGGIYYFMDVLDKPHLELQANMKLWWVHNESIIAVLYAYYLTKDNVFLTWFKKINKWTWKHFPDKKYGEWFAYLDRTGKPTHLLKGGKWKTFFHLPRFLLKSIELMGKINTQLRN